MRESFGRRLPLAQVRDGDRVRVFMKLQRDAGVLTANYNTEHAVEYRRLGTRAGQRLARLDPAASEDERRRSGRNRALAAEWRLGATHPDDEIAIRRIINTPSRGIGRTTIFRVTELARERGKTFGGQLRRVTDEDVGAAQRKAIHGFEALLEPARPGGNGSVHGDRPASSAKPGVDAVGVPAAGADEVDEEHATIVSERAFGRNRPRREGESTACRHRTSSRRSRPDSTERRTRG